MRESKLEDLPLFKTQTSEPKYLTVTEVTSRIRSVLEPPFSRVLIRGEVSNFRPSAAGHAYFSLKDEGANLSAAFFGWKRKKNSQALVDGAEVLCKGKITIYPPRGSYQLVVEEVEALGAGALQVAFERLKKKLASEGLFAEEAKKKIPHFPKRIALITSAQGAAVRDFLSVLKRRAPHVSVLLIPSLVQGEGAEQKLRLAIEQANRFQLGDVIVLTRGGGSIEDLWCFNEEVLARAIAQSEIPVVSAVGHEIDFTISDFVSDYRAPTPSAAAEILSGHWIQVQAQLEDLSRSLYLLVSRELETQKARLSRLMARLISPKDRVREQMQRLDDLSHRLQQSIRNLLESRRAELESRVLQLRALSPLNVLERGYSILKEKEGDQKVIKSSKTVRSQQNLTVVLSDGEVDVTAH